MQMLNKLKLIFIMLTFIGTVFSQNNLILKADNVQVTEDESVNINILKRIKNLRKKVIFISR